MMMLRVERRPTKEEHIHAQQRCPAPWLAVRQQRRMINSPAHPGPAANRLVDGKEIGPHGVVHRGAPVHVPKYAVCGRKQVAAMEEHWCRKLQLPGRWRQALRAGKQARLA